MIEPLESRRLLTAYPLYSLSGGAAPGIEVHLNPPSLVYMPGKQAVSLSLDGLPTPHTDVSASASGYAKPNGITLSVGGSGRSVPLSNGGGFGIGHHARHTGKSVTITLTNPGNTDAGGVYYSGWSVLALGATLHTANLSVTDSPTLGVEQPGKIIVKVLDDWGQPVPGATVVHDKSEQVGNGLPGEITFLNNTASADANGLAVFNVRGKATGTLKHFFSSPDKGGEATAIESVRAVSNYKRWEIVDSGKIVNGIWGQVKPLLNSLPLLSKLKDIVESVQGVDSKGMEDTLENYLRGAVEKAVAKVLGKLAYYQDVTIRDGHGPERFAEADLPDIFQSKSTISVVGIELSLNFVASKPTLSPNGTTKSFFLKASGSLFVDPTVFGFKGRTGGDFFINLGVQSIDAGAGTLIAIND